MSEQFIPYARPLAHRLLHAVCGLPLLLSLALAATGCGEKKTDKPAPPRPVR